MKVVAFNGSSRKDGNTAILVNHVFEELQRNGIQTEMTQLAGKRIHGCIACRKCFESRNGQCVQNDDIVNECISKMVEADGIILASPVYFADVTPQIKSLMDRAGYVSKANDNMLKRKVGASVVAVRRAGAMHAFDTLNHFFLISEMIIPGSQYWNIGIGREKGEVKDDREGIETMQILGRNMAWLLEKLLGKK